MAERLGFRASAKNIEATSSAQGIGWRPMESWIAEFDQLDVGGEQIHKPRLTVTDIGMTVDLILGADFFLSHRVYVAHDQHRLYFTYNGGPVFRLEATASAATETARAETKGAADPDALGRLASTELARRDYARAIADLNRALELAPDSVDLLMRRGRARMAAGDSDLAEADFSRALKLRPDDAEARLALAELKLKAKKTAAAEADLDALAKSTDQNLRVQMRVAALYADAHRFPKAIAIYDAWIAAHRGEPHPGVLVARCRVRGLSGEGLDQALSDCDEGMRYGRPTAEEYEHRGLVRLRLNRLSGAIYDYDQALALQPKLAWALYGRGLAKIGQGRDADGRADIAAALALNADLADEAKSYGLATPVVSKGR
jgi:tetratricopeptide (TPR) repeat protein